MHCKLLNSTLILQHLCLPRGYHKVNIAAPTKPYSATHVNAIANSRVPNRTHTQLLSSPPLSLLPPPSPTTTLFFLLLYNPHSALDHISTASFPIHLCNFPHLLRHGEIQHQIP